MANNLNTAQRAAFSGGSFDIRDFPRIGEIDDNISSVIDISKSINSFGETVVEAYNLNPSSPGSWSYPSVTWRVLNGDGYFSPGRASSIWGIKSPKEFSMNFRVLDLKTDPSGATQLVEQRFQIVEVSLVDREAFIVGIIPLAGHWARRWVKADNDEIDWNGHNEEIVMP